MSLIINGMNLPKHSAVNGEKDTAYRCVVLAHPDNTVELVIDTQFASPYGNDHNVQRYPLTEIPTPHGRLIDADKLVWFIDNHIASGKKWVEFETIEDMINSLPTIIKAEVSE